MRPIGTTKFGFRIRTRTGLVLDHLMIHGRDAADANRKLERMYPNCTVLECRSEGGSPVPPGAAFADMIALVTRRRAAQT